MDAKTTRAIHATGFLDGAAWAVTRMEAGDTPLEILSKALAAQDEPVIAGTDGLDDKLASAQVIDGLAHAIGLTGGAS